MATATQTPAGPVQKAMGLGMQKLQMKQRSAKRQMHAEGRLQPATIVNLNPFGLRVEAGALVTATVPSRKPGEKYAHTTITEPRFAFPFKGVLSANNGTELVNDYDVLAVLPIQQAMEFYKSYMETTQDMSGGVMGGVLIFEGEIDVLEQLARDKKVEVRVPYIEILEDGTAFVSTKARKLQELWDEAANTLRQHCLAKLQQANSFHSDPAQVKNITNDHRTYAKFALEQGWIIDAPLWLNHSPDPGTLCKKCKKSLPADAYMCACGKVRNPLEAYRQGDVEYGHVSFQLLDTAGWKEVKRIKAERDKAAE